MTVIMVMERVGKRARHWVQKSKVLLCLSSSGGHFVLLKDMKCDSIILAIVVYFKP